MTTVIVYNLSNPDDKISYTCTPRQAVIAAYAQNNRDYNTWQYEERYGKLVEETEDTWLCGDFCALKDTE